MFVDRAKIYVKAGSGGKGCHSFVRRKFQRHFQPNGGDGGRGGDVIVKADKSIHTLLDFQYRQHVKAESGGQGGSNQKKGKDGKRCLILVPLGTIVRDLKTGELIRDLANENEQVILAKGGPGGAGNYKRNQLQAGVPGEERTIFLELKLIADIGLIGCPNAGKSSFLNIVSEAKSKVANYPFTTLNPVLGVVKPSFSDKRLIFADIPGLIEDAHKGKGLGTEFLRHIERTKFLLFLIDMAGVDGRDPYQDYLNLKKELEFHNKQLLKKPYVLGANKMDLSPAKENLKRFRQQTKTKIFPISCKTNSGIDKLISFLAKD